MELFEEQVKEQPSAVALIPDGAPELSYAELNRSAEQVANEILGVGVSVGDVAVLILDRSVAQGSPSLECSTAVRTWPASWFLLVGHCSWIATEVPSRGPLMDMLPRRREAGPAKPTWRCSSTPLARLASQWASSWVGSAR